MVFSHASVITSSSLTFFPGRIKSLFLSTFEYNLNQCAYDIEGWYNSETIRLANELENIEKLHDIANYMLQYKCMVLIYVLILDI